MLNKMPSAASLLLTENCNLACKYCFEKHNRAVMTKEVARASIDFLADSAKKNGEKGISVTLFGGEPFLNIPVAEEVLRYGFEKTKQENLDYSVMAITNATIMNDRLYSLLKEYRDRVHLNIQLSVDGIPEVHDEYRVTKDGGGSFELVRRNIPVFQELFGNNPDNGALSIHGCINKKSLPYLYRNYRFFRKELNFRRIWFLPVAEEEWDIEDVERYGRECSLIYEDYIREIRKTGKKEDADFYAPFCRFSSLGKRNSRPCGAGNSFVTITADGDIYPCHEIYFNDEASDTLLGNVFEKKLDEDRRRIFTDYEETDLNCGNCECTQCYRCIAANWVHNGSLFSQIKKNYCLMSSVDLIFQTRLKKFIEEEFPQNKKENLSCEPCDCLCNSREAAAVNGCDVVVNQKFCQSGNNPLNPGCLCDIDSGRIQYGNKKP